MPSTQPAPGSTAVEPQTFSCPVCGSTAVSTFIEIPNVPTLCNALWTTQEEALGVSRGMLQLGFCEACGHIYNYAFDPDRIAYTQAYENSLHFSPRFQQYADALTDRLIADYDLRDKLIVEIGCGKGDFLKSLCDKGNNKGVGFDPSYEPELTDAASSEAFTVIQDLYSERYAHHAADLICCRHVLEHIRDPRSFVRTVRQAVGDRLDTVVFFEVPNVWFTLREMAIWDLIYEHCSYFSPASLGYLFSDGGFDVHRISPAFGGQYLCIEASPRETIHSTVPYDEQAVQAMQEHVASFAQHYREKVTWWHRKLDHIRQAGQRAVIWGAGSKGITISNILALQESIEYVVDVNPRKEGMYITGTGQRIVSPAFLRTYQPDFVIMMNALYEEEIRQQTRELGLIPEFLIA